jgi:hypothetical protein
MPVLSHHSKLLVLVSILLCLSFSASAFFSAPDSLKLIKRRDSTVVQYFYHDFEKFGGLNLHYHDTTITGFQNVNPLFKKSPFFATLGNLGQNYRSLIPPLFQNKSGFDYGIHTFDNYLFSNDSIKYFKVFKTFTELEYEQGAKRELMFHFIFSRNIYRSFNLGADFRALNSPGAYLRQKANHLDFTLTAQFLSKNKRYGMVANFRTSQLRNNENGGIANDTMFEQNLEANRQIIPVNLEKAKTRVRENGLYTKHYFNLSRHPRSADDSAYFSTRHFELGRITYSFDYNRQVQNYVDEDPTSGYYPDIFIDSTKSFDSLVITRIINQVTWSNPSFRTDKKFRVLQLEAFFRQLYAEVSLHGRNRYILQYIPAAEISFHPYSTLYLKAYGDYVLGDYNQNDFSFRVSVSQVLGRPDKNAGTISARGFYAYQKPGFFFENYSGNHNKWDTSWVKQSLISASFNYTFGRFIDAGVNISRINHFVYLDTAASPRQLNSEFGYIIAYLNGEVDVWKFKFKGQLAYQSIQGTNVLRLPGFMGNLSIYFTQPVFHNAAVLQPGLNFFYNTRYYGNAYMPSTRSFYLQDKEQIGNYLYMDVFLNVKIQRARIFLSYTNFGSFFLGRTYYMVPDYPMQDAAFKFGVAWRFHD